MGTMTMAAFVRSDEVRRVKDRLDHPIIDADGHQIEFIPLVREFLRETADGAIVERFDRLVAGEIGRILSARVFWGFPVENVVDRESAVLPELLYQRLDEIGIDFA